MFDRLKNVVNGMLNKTMNKMETPEVLAQEAQDELESHVKKLKEALTESMAQEKLLEQQMRKNAEELKVWEGRAGTAVDQGNDELAKQCLQKKQEILALAQNMDLQRTQQKKATAQLKERFEEVEHKYTEFMRHKSTMTARAQASEATAKANELISGAAGGSGMDKWEQKIREKEALGDAMGGADAATDAKFKKLDEAGKLDDELAALKEKMGTTPKLVVDSDADKKKEVVDENLPMVIKDVTKPQDDKGTK